MTKKTVAKARARTKPRTEKPVDSEIRRAAKRARIDREKLGAAFKAATGVDPEHVELTPAPQEDVYRRLLRDLRRVTADAVGAEDYLCQTIAELEAVEELLEYRENGGTTAADASLAAVVHGLTARLDLAVKLRAGLWDPDNPHATVLADTKVLPMREGGAT
jgi:hypothetical protein